MPTRPPPEYPASPYPFMVGGGLAPAAQNNAIVLIAMRYLGVRYKWGGANPKTGFDCSGLVQYVFAQVGISLLHYAAAQYYSPDSVWVPPNRLQPGDLVFFTGSDGTRKEPGHVAIYVGDGYIIDAPHTGSFVRVDSLNEPWFADKYVGAKRIVASFHVRLLPATNHRPISAVSLIAPQLIGQASGESPPLIAAVRTATHTPAQRGYALWTGVGLAGFLLLLVAGAVNYFRRRPALEANPSTYRSN